MKILALFICALWALILPASALAASDFTTSFISEYVFDEKDEALVTHRIDIKNNLSYLYTSQYSIAIGATGITDLKVTANGSRTNFRNNVSGNINTLTIDIAEPVIGKDQTLSIVISYKTGDLIDKFGSVRELNIPRLNRANEASLYTRRIIVPPSFGAPTIEFPHSTTQSSDESGNIILDYSGFPVDGITLLFGEFVSYLAELKYGISNPTLATVDTEIALPPDTEYQQVYLDSLEPRPKSLHLDADGNWMAVYSLKSQEKLEINAKLYISIYPVPTFPAIGQVNHAELIRPDKYWETESTVVRDLAANLKNPLNIYNYLTENFTYDYAKITKGERLGAEQALARPDSAICTEFTDTFVALSRAAGIPTREINGYAWTSDPSLRPAGGQDILHTWPEYYDETGKHWVQLDPTWGNTTGGIDYYHKMDFSHITFVRHGLESAYPNPAGTYKNNLDTPSVKISLTDSVPAKDINYKLVQKGNVWKIENQGKSALRNTAVTFPDGSGHTVAYLPPLSSVDIDSLDPQNHTWLGKIRIFFRRFLRL